MTLSQTVSAQSESCDCEQDYVFAWPFLGPGTMQPQGGTTTGPTVHLLNRASDAWGALREEGISKKERDRRAILAMAGPYRTSFDFLETVGFTAEFTPSRPYRSWGTEYVYVISDEPDFISLQHVMVMDFQTEDGGRTDPIVIKHWRQDWRYRDRLLHTYTGDNRWQEKRLAKKFVRGKWSQTVYQVDDSPRYEAVGEWVHSKSFSSWESNETWRPLPRREFSVREDYDVLVGTNRHTIIPDGWIHEEDNLKVALSGKGPDALSRQVLAREAGVNRYQRIVDYDWSAGDQYWQRTGPFWREVRRAWASIYQNRETFRIRNVQGRSLVGTMFEMADSYPQRTDENHALLAEIETTLASFIED